MEINLRRNIGRSLYAAREMRELRGEQSRFVCFLFACRERNRGRNLLQLLEQVCVAERPSGNITGPGICFPVRVCHPSAHYQ